MVKGVVHFDKKPDDNFYLRARKYLVDIILSKIPQQNNKNIKILDIGTNTGINIPILNKYGQVYAIDLNEKNLVFAREHNPKEVKIMDATKLEYPNNFFDIVCAFDILEHIPNHEKAASEIKRVLKKGGYCLTTVPAFNFLFSSHDRAVEHQRRYSMRDLKKLFKDFNLFEKGFWNSFFFLPIFSLRILKRDKDTGKEDAYTFQKPTNNLLFKILNLENTIIKSGFKFPIGLTIYAIFKNTKK